MVYVQGYYAQPSIKKYYELRDLNFTGPVSHIPATQAKTEHA
jgi:hypothetical protein